jgi:hypothetical protein
MLLAFVMIFVIFVIITGVLSLGFTAARTVKTYDRDRALHYSADAALEVAVQMVRNNKSMGETSYSGLCELTYTQSGTSTSPPDPKNIFAPGARLLVECGTTPGIATTSGGLDPNGRQRYRDVTFTVSCHYNSLDPPDQPLDCQPFSNPDVMVLGTARVRYEVDPGYTPANAAARIPKIVSWQVER